MKVRCVDNWMYEDILGRNKVYEVLVEQKDRYVIKTETGRCLSVGKDKFIIEEEKMQTTIVNKPLKKSETFTIVFKKPNSNKIDLKINDRVTIKNGIIDIPNSYKDKVFTIKNIFNNNAIISIDDIEVSIPLELLKKVEKENIKIDDKVVLRTDIAFQVPFPITKGTILNVDLIMNNQARVSTKEFDFVVPLDFLIRVEKGEKEMEKKEIRVVRKLEDLDGLKNDKGWELSFESTDNFKDKGYYQEWVRLDDKSDKGWFNAFYELSTKTIDLLIASGFKFEYKPLRTENEIMANLVEKEFKFGEGNFLLIKLENGKWDYMNNTSHRVPDKKYYTLESAKRAVKELNELLESEK